MTFHLSCCILLAVVLFIFVDDQPFWTASPPDLYQRNAGLYQTEVTGLLSAALLIIRSFSQLGSVPLIWRFTFVLLEKTGMSLSEICRMIDLKIPVRPRFGNSNQVFWSIYTIMVTLFLWPAMLSAPLANSALAWVPSRELNSTEQSHNILTVKPDTSFDSLGYPSSLSKAIVRATLFASRDPAYAFEARGATPTLRQYLILSENSPDEGITELDFPYFEVSKVEWLNKSDNQSLLEFNDASMLENPIVPQNFLNVGALTTFKTREEKWSSDSLSSYTPVVYEGTKQIVILFGHLGYDVLLDDGVSLAKEETPCSQATQFFGQLPQVRYDYVSTYVGEEWRATDCYMLGEVTIRAGILPGIRSNVSLMDSFKRVYQASPTISDNASFSMGTGTSDIREDKAVLPTLDMLSDVLGVIASQRITTEWQTSGNLDDYVIGMLTLAYHATWSVMPLEGGGSSNSTIRIQSMDAVVRASVNRGRIYGWLVLNSTFTVAAILVGYAQHISSTKTIRNTTLAALTIDFTDIAHGSDNGLCNAVALNSKDKSMGRMTWESEEDMEMTPLRSWSANRNCPRKLVLCHSPE